MKISATSLLLILAVWISAHAQTANPLTAGANHLYDLSKRSITAAAEKMPEADYSFRAVPEERSFAQFVGHVADANFALCAIAAGEKSPAGGFENGKTTKADLTKALADAYAYCDKVFAAMTDGEGTKTVKFTAGGAVQPRPEEMPRLSVLEYNTDHNFEHYGNLTVYMRLKGVVPPTSETLSMSTRGAIPLFAETDTHFFAKAVDAQIEFVKDEKGVVSAIILHLLGRDQKFIKKGTR